MNRKRNKIKAYNILSLVFTLGIIAILLYTLTYLPSFGDPNNPEVNEVMERYLEKGLEETGAPNAVAGMILDYRAFDTFGEATMLFTAFIGLVMLIRQDKGDSDEKN